MYTRWDSTGVSAGVTVMAAILSIGDIVSVCRVHTLGGTAQG